jgi:hypothetical protein
MADEHFEPNLLALQAAAGEVPVDDVIRLLSTRAARDALVYLHDRSTATLEELADVVVGAAASADGSIAGPADRERVRVRLYHTILPWSDDLGFVAFDSDAAIVTETDVPGPVVEYLGIGE